MASVASIQGYQPHNYRVDVPEWIHSDNSNLIVKPALEKWMQAHPDEPVSPEAAERIRELISTKPRDRRYSWSASSAGMCLRRQELSFLGVPGYTTTDPRALRIFANGTWVHLRYQAALLTAGIVSDIERKYALRGLNAQATVDGIGIAREGVYKGEKFIVELKGRNDLSYSWQVKKSKPDDKTLDQVYRQLLLSGYELDTVVNENKNDQSLTEFVVERDSNKIRESAQELKELQHAVDNMRLSPMLPECIKQNKTGEFYKCPFGTPLGACINSGRWPKGV